MKNIIDICKDYGVEIPVDKHTDFLKTVAGEYKTIAEHNKVVDKLATATKRAEDAEATLKGFDGIDPAKINDEIANWKKKAEEAEANAQKQIEERDFNDVLKTELDGLKFSSSAARKAVESEIRSAGLKLKDGKILGLSDLIDQIKTADASAFVDEKNPPAQFTQPGGNKTEPGGTPDLGKLSMAEYIAARRKK